MEFVKVKGCDAEYHIKNYGSNPLRAWFHTRPLELVAGALGGPYERTLEVGCASGVFLPTLCAGSREVIGIDISDKYFKDAMALGLKNLKLMKQDAAELEFEDGQFDLVVCLETLEHVPDPNAVIWQINRVLKPGGVAAISVPIEIGPALLMKYIGRAALGYRSHFIQYSLPELARCVAGEVDREHHKRGRGHKNFDYRDIIKGLEENGLKISRMRYFPFNVLRGINTRVILIAKKPS